MCTCTCLPLLSFARARELVTTNGFKRPDKHGQGGGRIGDDGDDAAGDVDIAGEMLMLLLMMSR